MLTHFSDSQLSEPALAEANRILRTCVCCGFCAATCPTYVLRADELDSPRGRIHLIRDMLESGEANPTVARHLDRCLSCFGCMTTCPSGVDYLHLSDFARTVIHETHARSIFDRLLRAALARLLPYPRRLRPLLAFAAAVNLIGIKMPGRIGALLRLAPRFVPHATDTGTAKTYKAVGQAEGKPKMRAALMPGCVQQAIAPEINDASLRLLNRLGCEVVVAEGSGCCGALGHHLGRRDEAQAFALRNVAAWTRESETRRLDAVIANASGCGTMLKDYGHVLADHPSESDAAKSIAALTADISEVIDRLDIAAHVVDGPHRGLKVAYHPACSLAHGQQITDLPARLLTEAGFEVLGIKDAHLCCGSAGTYNILQPEIATELATRKAENISATGADVVATGNIGCITQLKDPVAMPIVHTVELLDWATGGPRPAALDSIRLQ